MQPYTGSSWLLHKEGTIVALPGHQQVATSIRYILSTLVRNANIVVSCALQRRIERTQRQPVYVLLL